jgi:predicted transcriptional regulator
MPAKVISIRLASRTLKRLDRLARPMDRSRAWLLEQAIDRYIEQQDWLAREVERGVEQADRGGLMPHNQVMSEIREKLRKRRRQLSAARFPF